MTNNKYFKGGSYVPRDFKYAHIRPLLEKPGLDPDTLKHYRHLAKKKIFNNEIKDLSK